MKQFIQNSKLTSIMYKKYYSIPVVMKGAIIGFSGGWLV